MRSLLPCFVILILMISLTCAGCIFPPHPPEPSVTPVPPTTAPATMMPVMSPAPGPSFTHGTFEPTQVTPSGIKPWFQIMKLPPWSEITLQCNGGEGLAQVQGVHMNVTLSDGTRISRDMVFAHPPNPSDGDRIIIKGTRGRDRAEVWVIVNGQPYKVIDEIVPEPGV